MSSQAAMLVAFFSGTAAVGTKAGEQWWLDADVQARLRLTPQQVRSLSEIHGQRGADDQTSTQWRMYQTLSPAQRQQFAGLLEVVRRGS